MGDARRGTPPVRLALTVVVGVVLFGGCASSGPGRLAAGTTSAPTTRVVYSDGLDWSGGEDATTSTTGAPVTSVASTAAPATAAPATSPPCVDPGGVAAPSAVEGYTVTPDDSAALSLFALPPGMQGTRLVHVSRSDGAVADLISLTGAAYAFGDLSDAEVLDRFARSVGVTGAPAPLELGGHDGVVVRTSSGSTLYAWMPCRNSVLVVVGRDAAMAADVVARVNR